MKNGFYFTCLFFVLLAFSNANLVSSQGFKANISSVVGFKDVYLGSPKGTVIDKLNKYSFKYKLSSIKLEKEHIDPYLLMSKEFFYRYVPSYLLFEINGSPYYIDFKEVNLFHSFFNVSFEGDGFLLYYNKLSKLIIRGDEARLLNPYLKDISFYFFDRRLYEIRYAAQLSTRELNRLLGNFASLYGKPKFSDKGKEVKFTFLYGGIVVSVKAERLVFSKLLNIKSLETGKVNNKHDIFVSISLNSSLKKVITHKEVVYDIMLDMFKERAETSLEKIKGFLEKKKLKDAQKDKSRRNRRYRYVDELSG